MSDANSYVLDDEHTVFIETFDVDAGHDVELVSRDDKNSLDFSQSINKALPAAKMVIERLENIASNVKEVEVEFGLKFSGEVGALIAKTGTEANFKIKLVWSPNAAQS